MHIFFYEISRFFDKDIEDEEKKEFILQIK